MDKTKQTPARVSAKDRGFFGGILTALAIIHLHGEDTIFDEVIGTLDTESLSLLIEHAKINDELEWSGLADYLERTNER